MIQATLDKEGDLVWIHAIKLPQRCAVPRLNSLHTLILSSAAALKSDSLNEHIVKGKRPQYPH